MDAWLTRARDAVAAAAGIEPTALELSEEDERALLAIARIAAHVSGDRRNAPLLCFLVGRAVAGGAPLAALADAVPRDAP